MSACCINDTDGDGDCAVCARNPEALCRQLPQPPENWPEELRGSFWSAVNAPTYMESTVKTLAFVHALAEYIRSDPKCEVGGYGDGLLDASLMIDTEEMS